jgi:hypothetical protein
MQLGTAIRALRQSQLRAALAHLAPAERTAFVRSLAVLVEALRRQPHADCPAEVVSGRR